MWPVHVLAGEPEAWMRYAYVHALLLYERSGSGVGAALERKRRLLGTEARELGAAALDKYVNSAYRSLKNARNGLLLAAELDAAESVAPLLTALFAMAGRVRPYNRYLLGALPRAPRRL